MLLKLVNLSSSDSYTMVYTMDNIRSKVSSRNPKFKSELLFIITFAFTKYPFFAPEILLFQSFQFILIIPRTNNNIRQMFSEHFSSFFLPFFFCLKIKRSHQQKEKQSRRNKPVITRRFPQSG